MGIYTWAVYNSVLVMACMLLHSVSFTAGDSKQLTQILFKKGRDLKNEGKISTQPDFILLIQESDLWVDKSKFIEYVWDHQETQVYIITAPKRWGKTINLSMFGYYCMLPVDESGNPIDRLSSPNYKYFTEGQIVYDNKVEYTNKFPLIHDYKGNAQHLGMHPVIYINGKNLDCIDPIGSLRMMVQSAYDELSSFRWFLTHLSTHGQTTTLRSQASVYLKTFEKFTDDINIAPRDQLINGIKKLSQMLYDMYGKRVVILMHENESYISKAFFSSTKYNSDLLATFQNHFLLDFMFNTFKNNKYMAKGIIIGILPVEEATGLSNLNNVDPIYVFGESNAFPFFGILETEFNDLCTERGIDQTIIKSAKSQYDGYHILGHLGASMYSTYSIRGFINHIKVDNYWKSSEVVNMILGLFKQVEFQREMAPLIGDLSGNKYVLTKYEVMKMLRGSDYEMIYGFLNTEDVHAYSSAKHSPKVFALLLSLGLLSIYPIQVTTNFVDYSLIRLRVPNKEIQTVLRKYLVEALELSPAAEETNILENYMCSKDDKLTLPRLLTTLSNFLTEKTLNQNFGTCDRTARLLSEAFNKPYLGNEATAEHFLYAFFSQKLGIESLNVSNLASQIIWSHPISGSYRLDIFLMESGISAMIVELKYANSNKKETNIVPAFKQVLSYIYFYQPYIEEPFNLQFLKFLALRVHPSCKLEAMSTTLYEREIKEMIADGIESITDFLTSVPKTETPKQLETTTHENAEGKKKKERADEKKKNDKRTPYLKKVARERWIDKCFDYLYRESRIFNSTYDPADNSIKIEVTTAKGDIIPYIETNDAGVILKRYEQKKKTEVTDSYE